MAAFAVQVATRLSVIYLFGGSFNKVHCRYNRIVQPVSCFRVPPHGFFPDPAFGLPERRNGNRGWRAAPSWSTGDGMSGVAHCCADPTTLAQAPISEFGFKPGRTHRLRPGSPDRAARTLSAALAAECHLGRIEKTNPPSIPEKGRIGFDIREACVKTVQNNPSLNCRAGASS